jgi:hypothetical protein
MRGSVGPCVPRRLEGSERKECSKECQAPGTFGRSPRSLIKIREVCEGCSRSSGTSPRRRVRPFGHSERVRLDEPRQGYDRECVSILPDAVRIAIAL